ncbi:MAG TPA: DegQ family serine endoprotease [Burkholderiales bacterium]|nr:DegQ family serine endoprotease [Burkholderiales bacterium]
MNAKVKTTLIAASFALGGAGMGALSVYHQLLGAAPAAGFMSAPPPLTAAVAAPDFSQLVEANKGAVVSITSEGSSGPRDVANLFPLPGSPFRDRQVPPDEDQPRTMGLGSGFIIGSDGYILTNNHVVADSQRLTVKLADRRELPAKVIGTDPLSDVALIKVDAKNLPTVRIGESKQLKVGQWVVAIGAPFGLDYTATQGIISAVGRSLPNETYVPFIQTDAAVNPGNSGGPLFDSTGRVVGITSQIYSRTGGFMGLSFAIPIDVAVEVAQHLKSEGKVTRGWLGVKVQSVDQSLAQSFGMERPHGALIAEVDRNAPAAKAGLRSGDVIVGFNGTPVDTSADLAPMVGALAPGSKAHLRVLRKGEERNVDVALGSLPEAGRTRLGSQDEAPDHASSLNLAVTDLTDEQRQQLGVPSGGVLVEDVGPGAAARAGVQPGDVLLMLNGEPIRDAAQLESLASKLPKNKPVALLVKREGVSMFLALNPSSGANG